MPAFGFAKACSFASGINGSYGVTLLRMGGGFGSKNFGKMKAQRLGDRMRSPKSAAPRGRGALLPMGILSREKNGPDNKQSFSPACSLSTQKILCRCPDLVA